MVRRSVLVEQAAETEKDLQTMTQDAINRNRPAKNPGGMQCERCDEIFVGEDWHSFCAACVEIISKELFEEQTGNGEIGRNDAKPK